MAPDDVLYYEKQVGRNVRSSRNQKMSLVAEVLHLQEHSQNKFYINEHIRGK